MLARLEGWAHNTGSTGGSPWTHPRRPRGSQSGREKRRDESFHYGRKSPWVPTRTGPFPKIQADAGSWLGTKMLCILVPNRRTISMSSFRVFVHDSYCLDHALSSLCTKEMHAARKLSVHLIQLAYFVKCKRTLLNHIQVHEENEFCYFLFTSFTKREIRHFHG